LHGEEIKAFVALSGGENPPISFACTLARHQASLFVTEIGFTFDLQDIEKPIDSLSRPAVVVNVKEVHQLVRTSRQTSIELGLLP
jgi:hypothetical protein